MSLPKTIPMTDPRRAFAEHMIVSVRGFLISREGITAFGKDAHSYVAPNGKFICIHTNAGEYYYIRCQKSAWKDGG